MQSNAQNIKQHLFDIIKEMSDTPMRFVRNPGKDFTRKRQLPFDEMIHRIIALIAFEYLFHQFTNTIATKKTYCGYRLLAFDGTKINIPHNPNDESTYFGKNPERKGFNLLNLNAMYDLCNQVYVDAHLQPGREANEHYGLLTIVKRLDSLTKSIIIADRGLESYNALATIAKRDFVQS